MSKKKDDKNSIKRRLDISARSIVDNVVYSSTEKWAYYRLNNKVFDFLSTGAKINIANQISNAFSALVSDRQSPLDCHIIITNIPLDINAWAEQVDEIVKEWDSSDDGNYKKYMMEQMRYLFQQQYAKRVCYLGINLGKRGALEFENLNIFEMGFKGALDFLKNWFNKGLLNPDEVSKDEEDSTRKKENDFFRSLEVGHLEASRCTTEEILLLLKREMYPAMPMPYLDIDVENRAGPGDLDIELGHVIENKFRWLKVTQQMGEHEISGYRACLSLSKFPKYTDYPNGSFPFFYYPAKIGYPFTCYARFSLYPSAKMKAELEKKRKESQDELENMAGAQSESEALVNPRVDVGNNLQDLQEMSEMLSGDKSPWVQGNYKIVVEDINEEELKKKCSMLKQDYADLGITATWTAGDQALLFLEQMPGDRLRMNSFTQTTNLNSLSISGFDFSSDVGDPVWRSDSETLNG